ncbi:hypothetical protein JL720_11992 [Aureococcus anophagefferens]|nr:hypothetical protein JL720_11992 [Aureococcus anophagefferens]
MPVAPTPGGHRSPVHDAAAAVDAAAEALDVVPELAHGGVGFLGRERVEDDVAVLVEAASPKRPATVKLKKLLKNRTSSGPTAANATTGALALPAAASSTPCSAAAAPASRGSSTARRARATRRIRSSTTAPGAEGGVGWDDVVGAESAVRELRRLIDVVGSREAATPRAVRRAGAAEHPARRAAGTGKTLLARAAAESLDAPLLVVSGSEMVKGKYAGVGVERGASFSPRRASRAAAARGARSARDDGAPLVVVLAATNRATSLDAALLRKGRFDKIRLAFTVAHAGAAPEADDAALPADLGPVAGSGRRDVHAVVNEAALGAMADGRYVATRADYLRAVEDVLLGKPLEDDLTRAKSPDWRVAVHEAGHVLASFVLEGVDDAIRASVRPRAGGSLGVTLLGADDAKSVTRAQLRAVPNSNLQLDFNHAQLPQDEREKFALDGHTVSSMAAEAKPGWSSAPWRPKKEIRVPVVGRRPLRHQIEGKAANDDSVSDLIAQSSVGSASASSWLGLKKSSEAARAVQPGDSARPFFAEAVPDSTPLSLRAALERKKTATPHGPAGTTTYAMHLRSAEARHQREELRRAQGPTAHAEERFDGCAGLATKLGAMTRTPQGRVIAWDDKPVVNNGRKNVESTTEYWEELPAGGSTTRAWTAMAEARRDRPTPPAASSAGSSE